MSETIANDPDWVANMAQEIGTSNPAPSHVEARPFDIVWFTAENAAEAMRSLAWLPGGEEERIARCKAHHFRMWERVPAFNVEDGKRAAGEWICVTADRRGSQCLQPGNIDAGRVLIVDLLANRTTVKAGLVGGWIADSFWTRPEVVKVAAEVAETETRNAANRDRLKAAAIEDSKQRRESARRRYFETGARLVLPATGADPEKLETRALADLIAWGTCLGLPMVNLDLWMENMAPPEWTEPKLVEYDPVSFLDHAQRMSESMKNMG